MSEEVNAMYDDAERMVYAAVTARPVGGDTREALREELGDVFLRHWRTVTSGCECGELCLGQSYPRHLADAVLAVPAVRDALEAQETVRRDAVVRATLAVEAMRPHIPPSNDPERRTAVIVRSTLNRAARVVRSTLDGD